MLDTGIDNSIAADRLIAAHDGDVALLYIYYRHTGVRDAEQAAAALCRTLGEIRSAEEKLMRMGLLDGSAAPERAPDKSDAGAEKFLPPPDELPQYTAQEIARLAAQSHEFAELQEEAAHIKGRQLSSAELGILAGIYDHLSLSAEVIYLLLNYCKETAEARHPGSRPSMRQIQREAFRWANLELLTGEQAENYIARQRERSSAVGRVQEALDLQGRALTKPEREHVNLWLDMGFDEELIRLAYERTAYNTGKLSWPYLEAILKRWHAAGLHDREAVEKHESKHGPGKTPEPPTKAAPVDLDGLRVYLDKMNEVKPDGT